MDNSVSLKQWAAFALIIVTICVLTACTMGLTVMDDHTDTVETHVTKENPESAQQVQPDDFQEKINSQESEPATEPHQLRLAVVGDLMVHGPQLRAQLQSDGTYDFHNNFHFIKPWLLSADVVVGNLETTFAGTTQEYSSFPRFNTPDAFGEALWEAGFNGLSTVNNHSIDTGPQGFFRTLMVLEELGIECMGTRNHKTDDYWQLFTHDEIVLGITAVSYETPRAYGRRTLNALLIPEELDGLINSFDYHTWQEDLLPVKEQLVAMKEAGADITAVMIHWGEEYQLRHNQWQQTIANELVAAGADLILGSHPHVLQPVRPIQRDPEGRTAWVVYSSGNFISNQRFEILKRHEPEDGAIFFVDLTKDPDNGSVEIMNVSYQPTWVHRYWENNKLVYEILPLIEALDQPEKYKLLSSDSLHRAQKSLKRTTAQWYNLTLATFPGTEP